MTKKIAAESLIVPPFAVSAAHYLLNMSIEKWILYFALLTAILRLLLLFPRFIGCARCFRKHGTCTLVCKGMPQSELSE